MKTRLVFTFVNKFLIANEAISLCIFVKFNKEPCFLLTLSSFHIGSGCCTLYKSSVESGYMLTLLSQPTAITNLNHSNKSRGNYKNDWQCKLQPIRFNNHAVAHLQNNFSFLAEAQIYNLQIKYIK